MIKVLAAANRHPTNRSLPDFQRYWAEPHGPLFAQTRLLRRYVQNVTLAEAYGGEPAPTLDGASIFWYDSIDALRTPDETPEAQALRAAVRADDQQLFDRSTGWPADGRRASVVATEKVIVDGPTTPSMVKSITMASRRPGLTLEEFFDHWQNLHGPLARGIPGLRRYVQNHAVREAYAIRDMTHDGWAEMWFDDLAALRAAQSSPAMAALREDAQRLFTQPMDRVIAREFVQKSEDVPLKTPDIAGLSDDEICARLRQQGYTTLAADATVPGKLRAAAARGALAIWFPLHIVTIDESHIDARPG